MRYFVDSEFLTLSSRYPSAPGVIVWLSVALVTESGPELYLEHRADFSSGEQAQFSPFVRDQVLPKLTGENRVTNVEASQRLRDFVADEPEFWGDCAAFDYVVLSQIMGSFEQWPSGWPFFIRDIQQMAADFRLTIPAAPTAHNAHHALADARVTRDDFVRLRRQWEDRLPDLDPDEDESEYESPSWRFAEPAFPMRGGEALKVWAESLEPTSAPLLTGFSAPFPRTIDGAANFSSGPFYWRQAARKGDPNVPR